TDRAKLLHRDLAAILARVAKRTVHTSTVDLRPANLLLFLPWPDAVAVDQRRPVRLGVAPRPHQSCAVHAPVPAGRPIGRNDAPLAERDGDMAVLRPATTPIHNRATRNLRPVTDAVRLARIQGVL